MWSTKSTNKWTILIVKCLNPVKRRDFVKKASLLGGLVALGPGIAIGCKKKDSDNVLEAFSGSFTLDLGSSTNAALLSTGGAVHSNNVVVMNSGGGYTTLSAICTHQGCTVEYKSTNNRMECPCHGGVYDINGRVISVLLLLR